MGARVIVMEGIDSVDPRSAPAVLCEKRLEALFGLMPRRSADRRPIDDQRQTLVVGNSAIVSDQVCLCSERHGSSSLNVATWAAAA